MKNIAKELRNTALNGQADTGGLKLSAASGGLQGTDGVIEIAAKIPGNRTVLLGDSLLGQECTIEDFDPTTPYPGAYSTRARGMVSTLNARYGRPFNIVYFGGVTGTTTTQILARTTKAFVNAFDVLFEDGGTNDISLTVNGTPQEWGGSLAACEDGVVANRIAVWNKARAKGCGLINAIGIPAVGSVAAWSTAQKTTALRINRRLRDAARSFANVRFHDIMEASVDTASVAGLAKASVLYDNDKHHSAYGGYLYSKKMGADNLVAGLKRERLMVSSPLDCVQSDASSKNLLNTAIGLVTGTPIPATGTGVTGGNIVTGMSVGRFGGTGASIAASIVPAPSGVGNAQRFVITSAVAGDQVRVVVLPGISITEFPKGSWGYFEAMVKITGATGLIAVSAAAGVQFTGGSLSSPQTSFGMASSTTETGSGYGDETLTLVSEPVYFPADATGFSFIKGEFYPTFGAAGGATLDFYQLSWIKL